MSRHENEWDRDRDRDRDRDQERERYQDRPAGGYGSRAGWGGQGFNQGSFGHYGGQGERLWTQQGGGGWAAEHGYSGRESGAGMGSYNAEGRGGSAWGGAMGTYNDRESERWGSRRGYGQSSEGWRREEDRPWQNRNRSDDRGDWHDRDRFRAGDRDRDREDWGRDWGGQGFSGREGGWGGYGSYDRESASFRGGWRDQDRSGTGYASRTEGSPGYYNEGRNQGWQGQYDRPRQRWSSGAQQDWSRRGQFSGRGPKGWQRSDERIREDVNERLTDHPDVDASDIDVEVRAGEVWLRGAVDSRDSKRLAEDIAEAVSGVRDVHNEVRVNRGFWGTIKDAFTGDNREEEHREESRTESRARRDDESRQDNRRDRSGQPETTTGDRVSTMAGMTHTVTPPPETTKSRT